MNFFKKPPVLLAVLLLVINCSCQRDIDLYVPDNNNVGQILNPVPVQASVSGKLVDQNDNAISGAMVRSGLNITTTDSRGLFRFNNIIMDKYASVVTVEYNGYFKGIRTFSAAEGSSNFIKIKLIPKILAASINASAGGTAMLPNNSSVTLTANSVVVKATGQVYAGAINVYAVNIDPTAADIAAIIPGSFQAIDAANFRVLLKSYGMMAVQLEGQSGEILQIENGKTAKLHFTIPPSLSASAPATIPLWSLNETDGLWKEEGQATKSGNAYDGNVSHFSFWNCDVPSSTIYLELTVNSSAGSLPGTLVKITRVNTGAQSFGYTDSTGHVGGLVFSNEPLALEILSTCNDVVYAQNIGPFSQNTNLGTVIVTIPALTSLTITGTALNCNNQPVTNGNAYIYFEGTLFTSPVINGSFSTIITRCSASAASIEVTVYNIDSTQLSTVWLGSASAGTVNTGTLTVCTGNSQEFINYMVNGAQYSFASPAATFGTSAILVGNTQCLYVGGWLMGSNPYQQLDIFFTNTNVVAGGIEDLVYVRGNVMGDSTNILTPIAVNITEAGNAGTGYISGNFTGNLTGVNPQGNYFINCSFRIRRT